MIIPLLALTISLALPNNKIGIHLAVPSEQDLQSAARLVNSNHGDWGYVTLVIQENDRHQDKWQAVFDQLRRLHLIPIIRLATAPEGDQWRRPSPDEADQWADFLDSLIWVTKNRYVILFNEPNHATEWGGQVETADYGQVALQFAHTLKAKNPDFFVMLAGLDAAAPSQLPQYEDEAKFLKTLLAKQPELFADVDGWASHSYPNHGFASLPTKTGRNSVKTYQWEGKLLKQLGVTKTLPVFITEAGWPHQEGLADQRGFYPAEQVAGFWQTYLADVLADPQVMAITPFILNYQGEPFDHFSWQKPNSTEFYPQFATVLGVSKQAGQPIQEQKLVITNDLPGLLYNHTAYQLKVKLRNEGQALWSAAENYQLCLVAPPPDLNYFFSDLAVTPPFGETENLLEIQVSRHLSQFGWSIAVCRDDQPVSNLISWKIRILPKINLWNPFGAKPASALKDWQKNGRKKPEGF